jgi:uncharacterized Rossmann fold enzyme
MKAMKVVVSPHEWRLWYQKIVNEFGYDPNRDQLAADILSRLIYQRSFDPRILERMVSGKPVLIFGAGPSLKGDITKLKERNLLRKFVVICADGATSALLNVANRVPNIIVSDLDGFLPDLIVASRSGSVMVIHGHGDNIKLLKRYVPLFDKIVGTTQVEPRPGVYNFGGFTDGDRAVFLAASMEAKLVVVAGMDLGEVVGEYSKKHVKSVKTKILKLKICKELLEWLCSKVDIPFYNVTGRGESIKGFINVTCPELEQVLGATI